MEGGHESGRTFGEWFKTTVVSQEVLMRMRSLLLIIIVTLAVTLFQTASKSLASLTFAGTITGTVKGPDGARSWERS